MRDLSILFFVAAAALLTAASCGDDTQGSMDAGVPDTDSDSDTDADTDADSDSDSDTDTGYDAGPDSGPGAYLTGRWGELLNVTIIQTGIPILSTQWIASRNWYVVDITTDGEGHLTAHERLCSIKLKLETWLNSTSAPQYMVDSCEVLERHVTLEEDSPGTAWYSDVVNEVRGANLCDPISDPLPANNSASGPDESVSCDLECNGANCDQDDDGHPGITNILTGALNCEVYATQRWWARLDGQIVDEDTIAGAVVDNFSEQTVVEASTFLCQTGNPGTTSENCPEHQYFKMVRLADDATCADVLALTDCDEDEENCDTNEVLPLDPFNDLPSDCD